MDSETFRAHSGAVLRFLRRLGASAADAEDLLQEVFVTAHRRQASFDATRPMRPWLYGIAYNVHRDAAKRAYRRREVLPGDVGERGTFATPAQFRAICTDDARTLVGLALEALHERQRAIFVLHELEGHPIREVASLLDLPVRTTYDRLEKARQRFSKEVRRLARLGQVRPTEPPLRMCS